VSEFITDLSQQTFLQYALLTGFLASIACGIIGSYVVTRRITYIAGSIAHSALAGLGVARFFQVVFHYDWFHPLYGAVIAALLAAVVIGIVTLKVKEREDTIIGAVWAIGMALGILMVSADDLWLIAGLDILIVIVGLLFYNRFLAVCFDEEFARLRGINVEFYYLLLLCLTALTVVLLVTVVGIVMVIALLTLPVAVAGFFSKRLWQLMALSVLFAAIFTTGGLTLSYGPNLPAGATTIVLAGVVYLIAMLFSGFFRIVRSR
jgi:zinc transport system permease protein